MLRTLAVLLLLLGLATATPVACLCAPLSLAGPPGPSTPLDLGATAEPAPWSAVTHLTAPAGTVGGDITRPGIVPDRAGLPEPAPLAAPLGTDAPSLVAAGAAASVMLLVATAAGLPALVPWRPRLVSRPLQAGRVLTRPGGPDWSPVPPPPRVTSLSALPA